MLWQIREVQRHGWGLGVGKRKKRESTSGGSGEQSVRRSLSFELKTASLLVSVDRFQAVSNFVHFAEPKMKRVMQ